MKFSLHRKRHRLTLGSCLLLGLMCSQTVFADEKAPAAAQPLAEPAQNAAPSVEPSTAPSAAPSAPAVVPSSPATVDSPQSPSAALPPKAPEWTFQLRTGLGAGKVLQEKKLKTDRLGVGAYAGKRLSDEEIALPYFDSRETSVGAAYQTFTGVDAAADAQWALQSIGVMLRFGSSPFELGSVSTDVLLQTTVSYQRMVAQDSLSGKEKVRHGAGLGVGTYLRTLAMDGVHVLGGTELLLGSASWFGVSLGLESNF